MTKYLKIKTMEGLTSKTEPQTPKLIPETTGISNAVTTFEDKNVKINTIPQSSLTANCWLVQMNGFDACKECEFFPFNRKTGKLLKRSECGGGETLAAMIYKTFKGSIMDAYDAQEFWKTHKDSCFVEFVETMNKKRSFHFSLKKYKLHIFNLAHIAQEQKQHTNIIPLDRHYPYLLIVGQYLNRKNKNDYPKLVFRKSPHYFTQYKTCECEQDPIANSKYKMAYRDVAFQLNEHITVYYYHQHAIVLEDHIRNILTLDSCGWRTPTTKERMNRYIGHYNVSQSKKIWYVYNRATEQTQEFFDGITIDGEQKCQ